MTALSIRTISAICFSRELWLAKTECQYLGCVCQMYCMSATLLQIANASVNRLDLEVEKIVLNKIVNKLMLHSFSGCVFAMLLNVVQSLTDAVLCVVEI